MGKDMSIEDRVAALKTALVAETGLKEIDAIEIRFDDLGSAVACTADGGDAIVLDRVKAEASGDDDLRFTVNHELTHACFLKHGVKDAAREFTTLVADDDPYAALLRG